MPSSPQPRQGKLPAHYVDHCGAMDYTSAGQAEADLSSAEMALLSLAQSGHLTPAQRRDFAAARRATARALTAVRRHVDDEAVREQAPR